MEDARLKTWRQTVGAIRRLRISVPLIKRLIDGVR
jgi:hypothetical protein